MNAAEYLDAAKARLSLSSDYELAKRLDVSKQDLSAIRKGKQGMNTYLAAKIAITLELDPSSVIADVESQQEKNPVRAEFWRGFLSRAAMLCAVVGTLAWSSFGIYGSGLATAGGGFRRRP
ncbi:MAG: hypothetical protein JSR19_01375 [Proteobacteria bacterium]|nr:hypothetical protein [Pseudomonadota bacterium]HQR02500.1 hypothetical protein [Rhodocyclaceae bacterium]